jgi:hypothetical protein
MRIFLRVVYALLATFTFLFAIDYARGRMAILYFENEGNQAIIDQDDSFFYGSARDYNQRGSLLEVEDQGYRLSFYEIADVKIINNNLDIKSYLYIILNSETELNQRYFLEFKNNDEVLELEFLRFRTINIMMVLNPELQEFGIPIELVLNSKNYLEINLLDQYKNVILTTPLTITNADLMISTKINEFYNDNEKLPFNELIEENIYPKFTHDLDDYTYIMRNSLLIYAAVLIFSIYIVFFAKRKYLGKNKPTDILIKEQDRYKKSGS